MAPNIVKHACFQMPKIGEKDNEIYSSTFVQIIFMNRLLMNKEDSTKLIDFPFYRLHVLELFVGVYLFFCASYDLAFGKNH